MKIIILAAGIGARLGHSYPKALTKLVNGETILEQQIKNITSYFALNDIYIVVGFKKELIMDAVPHLAFIYNEKFHITNTSQSLLRALEKLKDSDVIWMNGDVVFDKRILEKMICFPKSCMVTNRAEVDNEAVRYSTNGRGEILKVSKEVKNSEGEALGINLVRKADLPLILEGLRKCKENDYFEKGIEYAIDKGLKIYPFDIMEYFCAETDFQEDLNKINNVIQQIHSQKYKNENA